jgi:hypothetical protein
VTIALNTVISAQSGLGGGFANLGTAGLGFVTIADNSITAVAARGGGISNAGTLTLGSTLVARNGAGNCFAGALTSTDYNFSDDATCPLTGPHDQTNQPISLGGLANNGGPTRTIAIFAGGPAQNTANPVCPPPGTDQRGVSRPQGPRCDIGAFEVEQAGAVRATETPTPTRTLPPTPTLTPTPRSLTVTEALSQAAATVANSGQPGVPSANTVGDRVTVSGAASGSGTVTASMAWSLTATVPAGVPAGTMPVAVFNTTQGLQGFACTAVVAGAPTVACTGTTAGNALQGSTVAVVFGPGVIALGTVNGPGPRGAGGAVGLPLLPPPSPPVLMPLPGPAMMSAPPAPPVRPATGAAEVPVVPEADTWGLLAGGLAILGLARGWRARRGRGRASRRTGK